MHRDFQKYSPFREPKWRLDRVLQLVDNQPNPTPPSRRRDDKTVAGYYKFLLKWRSQSAEEQRMAMYPDNPPLFYAHLLYYHPDKEWRWIAEACILAGMSNEEIAEEIGTLPDTVEMYERLFFNVRDRLNKELWIAKTILGRLDERQGTRDGGLTEKQWALLLKLFGYYGGPSVLKVLISGMNKQASMPKSTADVVAWFDETTVTNLRRQAAAAARTFEVNKFNVMQLLELHLRLMEIDKAASSGEGPATDYERNVEAALRQVPWTSGRDGWKNLEGDLKAHSETHAELRASEMHATATGESVGNVEEQQEMQELIVRFGS